MRQQLTSRSNSPVAPATQVQTTPALGAGPSNEAARDTLAQRTTGKDTPKDSTGVSAGLDAAIKAGTIFERGAEGEAVREIQELLGLGAGGQTGEYGPSTEAAVKAFQAAHRIEANGRVGPQTLAALRKARSGSKAPIIDQHAMNSRYNYGYCGIATLMTTIEGMGGNHGVDIRNADQLRRFADGIYTPGAGSSGDAMARRLQKFGSKDAKFTTRGTVADIVRTLDGGKPVPVGFVSMGGKVVDTPRQSVRYGSAVKEGGNHQHTFGASGHWATVVAYEGDPRSPTHFLVNDSDTGAQLRLTRAELERHTGANQGIWMIPH
jgi:hypothetical protein